MKTIRFLVSVLAVIGLTRRATAQMPATDPATAFAQIKAVSLAPQVLINDPAATKESRKEMREFAAFAGELTVPLVEKFLRDFPDAPQRWEAIQFLLSARRNFTGPEAEPRKAAWMKRREGLINQAFTDPAVPAETAGSIAGMELISALRETQPADLARARTAMAVFRARAPDAPLREIVETMYFEALHASDPSAALAEARQLVAKDTQVPPSVENWITSVEFKSKPLDLKFPDLDGREIDLTKYRGKVVLLDFWATWCVPCMEQMPHLREVYGKLHAQGFEVIGITDDLPIRDPAKPRPVEKTLPALKEFLAQHDMPWPQLWDTRVKKTPGPKGLLLQFGIRSLPTYLLFDQNGRFVTDDLRGPKLEAEVRRLLGL